jgi:hypothetical protein
MKELALFGDSYADSCDTYKNTVTSWGWAKQLMNMYGSDGADNFAQGGSSLEFSVHNFLENHENYKRIVFVTTWTNRLHIPITFKKISNSNLPGFTVNHHPGLPHCEYLKNNFAIESSEDQQKLKAIKDYFVHITTGEYEIKYGLLRHRSLIDLVKKTRPDVIMIPARNYGFIKEYTWDLASISDHECSLFGSVYPDLRHNHMTPVSNKWMLEHVLNRLDGNFIDLDLNKIPKFKNYNELVNSL